MNTEVVYAPSYYILVPQPPKFKLDNKTKLCVIGFIEKKGDVCSYKKCSDFVFNQSQDLCTLSSSKIIENQTYIIVRNRTLIYVEDVFGQSYDIDTTFFIKGRIPVCILGHD